jgi:hypothetical protein
MKSANVAQSPVTRTRWVPVGRHLPTVASCQRDARRWRVCLMIKLCYSKGKQQCAAESPRINADKWQVSLERLAAQRHARARERGDQKEGRKAFARAPGNKMIFALVGASECTTLPGEVPPHRHPLPLYVPSQPLALVGAAASWCGRAGPQRPQKRRHTARRPMPWSAVHPRPPLTARHSSAASRACLAQSEA